MNFFPRGREVPRVFIIFVKISAMFTDQFKHELNSYMKSQGERLLATQRTIASTAFNVKSGALMRALSSHPTIENVASGVGVDISYPKYIRLLDLKKVKLKNGKYRKKKRYEPIYNKYVHGYLKSDVWRTLNKLIPKHMVRIMEDTFKTVK